MLRIFICEDNSIQQNKFKKIIEDIIMINDYDMETISEVIDISPGNLDSSLCFFQSSVSHDVLCI